METYTLKRDGSRALAFDGELLGFGSSRRHDEQERWFEVRIYRTASEALVVAGTGRSTAAGETDRCWAELAHTGEDVIRLLERVDKNNVCYLTRTASIAIDQAATRDERIAAVAHVRVA